MKRFVLLLVTVTVCGGLIYFLTSHGRDKTGDPLELVPQEVVFMLDWADAAGDIREFFDSGFGRKLTGIQWSSVVEQLDIPEQVRRSLEDDLTRLMDTVSSPLFREVFSKRVVCALLPIDPAVLRDNPRQAVMENLLMLVTPIHGRSFAQMFPFLPLQKKQPQVSTYKGIPVTKLFLHNGGMLYLASIEQQVVISFSPEPVKRSIDLSLRHLVRRQTGLAARSGYQDLKKHARGQDDFFLYVDLVRCKAMLGFSQFQADSGKPPGTSALTGAVRMALFYHFYKNIQTSLLNLVMYL